MRTKNRFTGLPSSLEISAFFPNAKQNRRSIAFPYKFLAARRPIGVRSTEIEAATSPGDTLIVPFGLNRQRKGEPNGFQVQVGGRRASRLPARARCTRLYRTAVPATRFRSEWSSTSRHWRNALGWQQACRRKNPKTKEAGRRARRSRARVKRMFGTKSPGPGRLLRARPNARVSRSPRGGSSGAASGRFTANCRRLASAENRLDRLASGRSRRGSERQIDGRVPKPALGGEGVDG